MIRAAFFACGFFVTLCGAAMLFIDRVVLTDYTGRCLRQTVSEVAKKEPAAWRLIYDVDHESIGGREVVDPPDWAGFCLLSVGGVTLLYSLCLPGRKRDEEEEG